MRRSGDSRRSPISNSSPETGRTHQIRVHLSAKGHPIAGDDFYGGASRWHGVRDRALKEALARLARPLLHASRIEIPEMGLDVEAHLPEDYERVLALSENRPSRRAGGCAGPNEVVGVPKLARGVSVVPFTP